jgi:hypothetical protein
MIFPHTRSCSIAATMLWLGIAQAAPANAPEQQRGFASPEADSELRTARACQVDGVLLVVKGDECGHGLRLHRKRITASSAPASKSSVKFTCCDVVHDIN